MDLNKLRNNLFAYDLLQKHIERLLADRREPASLPVPAFANQHPELRVMAIAGCHLATHRPLPVFAPLGKSAALFFLASHSNR